MTLTTNTTTTITMPKALAADLIKRLKPTIGARGTLSALNHVLVTSTASNGAARFVTTDMELTTRVTLTDTDGPTDPVLVPFSNLERLVKNTPKDGAVTIDTTDPGVAVIGNGTLSVKVNTGPVDEWPKLPAGGRHVANFPFQLLPTLLRSFGDASRPILDNVYVDADGTLAATDSYRITVADTGTPLELPGPILLPRRLAELTVKMTGKNNPGCEMHVDDDHATVTLADNGIFHDLTARLEYDGNDYANFRGLLPDDDTLTETVRFGPDDADRILSLKKLAPSTDTPTRIEAVNGKVTARIVVQDDGEYTVDLEAVTDTDGFVAAFNGQYLADILDQSDGKVARGHGPLKPWLTTDTTDDGTVIRRLLMPVRTS